MVKIQLKILDELMYTSDYAALPEYATTGSAGMDLRTTRDFILQAGEQILVPTGLAIHIKDENIGGVVLPRSGLGHREGIVLGNLVGLIDSDYQGELLLSMWNRGHTTRYFSRGDRVAQLVFMPIIRATLEVVKEFETTDRGSKGFGSSGV